MIGSLGESLVTWHLKRRGFVILERNWRYRGLEADIVAIIDRTLVIIEVKTRSSRTPFHSLSAVSPEKAARVIRLTRAYLTRGLLPPRLVIRNTVSLLAGVQLTFALRVFPIPHIILTPLSIDQ